MGASETGQASDYFQRELFPAAPPLTTPPPPISPLRLSPLLSPCPCGTQSRLIIPHTLCAHHSSGSAVLTEEHLENQGSEKLREGLTRAALVCKPHLPDSAFLALRTRELQEVGLEQLGRAVLYPSLSLHQLVVVTHVPKPRAPGGCADAFPARPPAGLPGE